LTWRNRSSWGLTSDLIADRSRPGFIDMPLVYARRAWLNLRLWL